MDTSKLLPGLSDADKWNSSSVTGLQFQEEQELPNVDEEFQNIINLTFEDHPEARKLVLELLYRSRSLHWTSATSSRGTLSFGNTKAIPRRSLESSPA